MIKAIKLFLLKRRIGYKKVIKGTYISCSWCDWYDPMADRCFKHKFDEIYPYHNCRSFINTRYKVKSYTEAICK